MELRRALAARRMVRTFRDEPVDDALLGPVLAAATRAPSAGSSQGVDLVVLAGAAETARYWDATLPASRRAGFGWPGLLAAPVLVVVCTTPSAYVARYAEADKARTGLGAGIDAWAVPYWFVDAGMAAENILLAALDAGLGACFFGVFDHEPALKAALGIPAEVRTVGTIALGHPAEDPRPGRSAARPRRTVGDVVHRGGW